MDFKFVSAEIISLGSFWKERRIMSMSSNFLIEE